MAKFYAVKAGKQTGILESWEECKASVEGFPGAKYKSFSKREDAEAYLTSDEITKSGKQSGKQSVSDSKDEVSTKQKWITIPTKDNQKTPEEYEQMKADAHMHLDALRDLDLISPDMYEKISSSIDVRVRGKQNYQAMMEARNWAPYPDHVDIFVDGSYNPETNEYGYGVYIDDGEKQQILYGRGDCTEGGRNIEGEVMGAKVAIQKVRCNPHYKSVTIYHDYQGIGSWADGEWQANKSYTHAYTQFVKKTRDFAHLQIDFEHVDGHTGVEGNEYVDKIAKVACGIELTPKEQGFLSQLSDVPGYPDIEELPEKDAQPQYDIFGNYMY